MASSSLHTVILLTIEHLPFLNVIGLLLSSTNIGSTIKEKSLYQLTIACISSNMIAITICFAVYLHCFYQISINFKAYYENFNKQIPEFALGVLSLQVNPYNFKNVMKY